MKCTRHMDYFLLFVCCNLHRFPIQWLVNCQYRIITTFSSQVWYKWHRQVDRITITRWLLNHWITMYYCITCTRTIMGCFHKTIPQGFHTCNKPRILQQIVKNFRIAQGNIAMNIFKYIQWFDITRKSEEIRFNPIKVGLFESSSSGKRVNLIPLPISKRTYLISV